MARDIGEWLAGLGLGKYAEAFAENDIDFRALPHLDQDDLKELGVSLGHRKVILAAIKAMNEAQKTEAADPHRFAPVGGEEAPSALGQQQAERRQLTVMFCDLVGSTELSRRLDPEDLREVMRRYQDAVAGAITRYEGYVAKFLGDGVLAYFGWPQAHEDQAQRAVRAGLDAAAAVAKLRLDDNVALQARVGIATGRVVVGDLVGEAAVEAEAVAGETPNLAARLQGVAAPGQVVIGAITRLLIGETFDLTDLGTHELKGFAKPVTAWHVVGVSAAESRFEAAHTGALTQIVGREHELGLLRRAWEQSRAGIGQVVLVSGEPGIGKSRLVDALDAELKAEGCTRITLSCSPYHTNSVLYPVIVHLERVLSWQDQDNAEVKLAKLEGALHYFSLALDEAIPLFASLLSLPLPEDRYPPLNITPQQQKQQTLDALVAWLLEEAERHPVLQVWEDLHWADPSTLELLALEIEQTPTVPILNVLTYRPEFAPPWPQRSHMTPLTLNRLERPEVEALITQHATGKVLPSEVVEHIVNKTDGVPLYVEELTKAILEADFMRERDGGYELTGPLSGVTIPATLQDSLMARLDRLPTIREVAQLGAVLGREFAYEMVQAIASMEEPTLQEGLERLVGAELLYQRGRPPRAKYIFKHALVRDAAYQSLLRRTRQYYHRQVAELLESRFAEIVEAQPELVAHHLTEAGMAEPAIAYWRKAGERASQRSAHPEAIAQLTKALTLLETLPDTPERARQELTLTIALGPALMATKGWSAPEVERTYLRAREIAQQVGDAAQKFTTTWGMWMVRQQAARLDEAQALAKEVLTLARQQDDETFLLQAHHAAWTTSYRLAQFQACREHAEQGIALYDIEKHGLHAFTYGGHDPGVCGRLHVSYSLWLLGYPDQALDQAQRAVTLAQELQHPFSLAQALLYLAFVHHDRQEAASAYERAEEAVALSAKHDFAQLSAQSAVARGGAVAMDGRFEEGIAQIREGVLASRATGASARESYFLAILAEACGRAGRVELGLNALDEALDLVQSTGERSWEAELHRLRGTLLMGPSVGKRTEAEAAFTQALEIARRQGAILPELRAAMGLAHLRQSEAKTGAAHDLVAPIYDRLTEGFETADLRDAKALLDELS